mmetsp:Transcript_32272/g.74140  ORF Transcript_32272/g.74140 Transcript_32272/m.74140 type:complete len:206 (+) Transcript_32272:99-716(+)
MTCDCVPITCSFLIHDTIGNFYLCDSIVYRVHGTHRLLIASVPLIAHCSSTFSSPKLTDNFAGDIDDDCGMCFSLSSITEGGTSLNSLATTRVIGRGAILMRATVSPHIMFVMGRRISTPAASRITSPTSIRPCLAMGDPAVSGDTENTRTIPSAPRFSLMPKDSDKKVTGRSGPTCRALGVLGDCSGQFLGIGFTLGVECMACS